MAALRDALQAKATARPPHLRDAPRPARCCGACTYYKPKGLSEGACRLYEGTTVKVGQTCDSWKAP